MVPLLAAALIREWWGRIYTLIFGSQLRLLQKLNESRQGLTEEEVKSFFEKGASEYPAVYQAYPFESWIAFMESMTLTTKENDRYTITLYGSGFLKYLVAQRLTFERPG